MQSIEESVDTFFYQIAYDLGIDRLSNWMSMFGFGDYTGIDIFEESKANMPTRDWKMSRHKTPWYKGDTIPVGIGQGYWTATPMQLAKATSVLVNEGNVTAPHLLRATIENGEAFDNRVLSDYVTYPPFKTYQTNTGTSPKKGCAWLTMARKAPRDAHLPVCLT